MTWWSWVLLAVVVILLFSVAVTFRDITRYLRIRRM